MEIRFFQIIVPLIAVFAIAKQIRSSVSGKAGLYETILFCLLWAGVAAVAVFPDFLSDLVAKVFGIKSNVNAIIFFALGLLFYFQLQMYKMLRKQDELLTELSRKAALNNARKK